MNRTRRLFLTLPVAAIALSACGAPAASSSAPTTQSFEGALPMNMSVTELNDRINAKTDIFVLDVRTPEEYTQDGHVKGSTLIPLPELATRLAEIPKDRPIAAFCRSGNRSKVAQDLLIQNGFTNVTNVIGGIGAWRNANLPTEY
ncbi:MAG: rhodanese-like domain-containing protein [Roseiflexaceae bacterium]